MSLKVKSLFVYPVKSCNGIEVSEATVGEKGFLYDRYWIIVDGKGNMVTMRQVTELGRIKTQLVEEDGRTGVVMSTDTNGEITVMEMDDSEKRVDTTVWGATMHKALDCGDEVGAWIDSVVGVNAPTYRLLQCPKDLPGRSVNMLRTEGVPGDFTTGFADGYPYLLILQSSIDVVNKEAKESPSYDSSKNTLDVRRFRPNILVEGEVPHDDDDEWLQIEVGDATFYCVTACERCVMTTINPDTLKMDPWLSPSNAIRLLKKYRQFGPKRGPLFGQNCVSSSHKTTVRTGDPIYIKTRKSAEYRDRDLGVERKSKWPTMCAAASLTLTATAAFLAWRRSSTTTPASA
eukprot:TRINITY_DN5215_c0_g5_i1.p1 TRINITY_DN5215_c0_g5~~TRINITY_DN5215_c0_g5_i1.p1  ORF type:complete len:346 (+),score=90.29 TRINITY_DN5215_c0_g5_i1:37-1074(+)